MGKKFLLYFLIAVMFFISCQYLLARDNLVQIANVTAIRGSLFVQRLNQANWSSAYVKMPDYLYDKLRTDEHSVADIEFTIGGHIGLDKSTAIQLTGPREAKDITQRPFIKTVILKAGTIWAKITKRQREFQFQTQGGVLGVKGTEFVMEESETEKNTTVYVLEGNVVYETPSKNIEASAGDKITIPWKKVPVVHHYKPEELRKECQQKYPVLHNYIVRSIIHYAVRDIPHGYLAVDIIEDPNKAFKNIAASQVSKHVPHAGGILGNIIRSSGEKKKKKPKVNFPYGLSPNMSQVNTLNPQFSWKKFPNAIAYWLFLSQKENMEPLVWNKKITSEKVIYPKWAKDLNPDTKYFWRLIALGENDQPLGKASQTYFTISPDLFSELSVNLISPVGEYKVSPAEVVFYWQKFPSASGYRVIIADNKFLENPLINVIVTNKSAYNLTKEEIKQIELSKTYYWQVQAQDKSGNTIGKPSKIQEFILTEPAESPQ